MKYYDVIIEGDITLNQSDLIEQEKQIDIVNSRINGNIYSNDIFVGSINFNNSSIDGDVFFNGSRFNGTVNFENVNFKGNVSFEEVNFSEKADFENTAFSRNARFEGCNFGGLTCFSYANFDGYATFNECKFIKKVYFKRSVFDKFASFRGTKFNGDASVEYCQFNEDTYFDEHCEFKNKADFSNSKFEKAFFDEIRFNEKAIFFNCTFNKMARFIGARFNRDADFEESSFNDTTYFIGSAFKGNAYFIKNNFAESTYFRSVNFSEIVRFKWTVFKGDAYFEKSTFEQTAEFFKSVFSKDAFFNNCIFFRTADFKRARAYGELNFEDAEFRGYLDLTKTEYDRIFIRWNSIANLIYDDATFYLLINFFKNHGNFKDADNCYYQFRTMQLIQRNWREEPVLCLFDIGAWIFLGYEKRPHYPVLWSLYFIILFGFFWMHIELKHDWISVFIILWAISFSVFFGYLILKNMNGAAISGIVAVLFSCFLIFIRRKAEKKQIDEEWISNNLTSLIPDSNSTFKRLKNILIKIPEEIKIWLSPIIDAFCFSATVFLSGTKLFVDPPAVIPEIKGVSASITKKIIILERLLGALFAFLLLLDIVGIVVKPI